MYFLKPLFDVSVCGFHAGGGSVDILFQEVQPSVVVVNLSAHVEGDELQVVEALVNPVEALVRLFDLSLRIIVEHAKVFLVHLTVIAFS